MTKRKQSESRSKTLKDLFEMELMDMYDAEHRIIRGLEKLAKAAQAEDVRDAFRNHLRETQADLKKIEQVFTSFGLKARAWKCEGIVGVLDESDEIASGFKSSQACDAALISAAQKVEHYEIATYGCLQEWAELLGNDEAATLLQEILECEKSANETFTDLARAGSNEQAMSGSAGTAGVGALSSATDVMEPDDSLNG
jgi:ferritin-like metal-binding protein YciE